MPFRFGKKSYVPKKLPCYVRVGNGILEPTYQESGACVRLR